jgi:uncharacterized protein YndB with AHSA1/START domain
MFWFLVAAASIIAIIVLVVIVGLLLPKKHLASASRSYNWPLELVWNTITDFANSSDWRKQLKKVEALPARNGHTVWKETDQSGQAIAYETLELVPHQKVVRQIADSNLPFGGTWTIVIKAESSGITRVEIAEDGIVFNPIFRFVAKFILGHTRTINTYLDDLGSHLELTSVCPAGSNSTR